MTDEKYEMVNHPQHYNSTSIETIEKMRRIWGNEKTALWCEMTAFKYRDRIGNKPENPVEQEVGKIKWYEEKAKFLYNLDKNESELEKYPEAASLDSENNDAAYDMNGNRIYKGSHVLWFDPETDKYTRYDVYDEPHSEMVKLENEHGECEAYPEDCVVVRE